MAGRLTQAVVEVLDQGTPAGRLTQGVVEVLRSTAGKGVLKGASVAKGLIQQLWAGPIDQGDLPDSGVTAGTYGQLTVDSRGRALAGATCDVAHGGTGRASLTAHGVLVGEGTGAVAATAAMTAGQLLVGQGASADPSPQTVGGDATLSAAGALTIGGGVVGLSRLASKARPGLNYLINGDLAFAQRLFAAGTLTAVGQDSYGPDRWRCCRENADLQYQRVDTNGALETGLNARYYGTLKKITNTGKLLVAQVLEGSQTLPLAGRQVTFQVKLKQSSAVRDVRLGLIQLTSSGTIDSIPANIVPTTWGINGTDPTLGTNLSFIAPDSVPTGASGTISGNAVSCTALTTWGLFAGTFTLPSNAKNVAAVLWSDYQFAAAQTVSWSEAQLVDGDSVRDWLPRPIAEEAVLVARYCQSYGGSTNEVVGQAIGASTTTASALVQLTTPLRASPTVTVSAAADWKVNDPGVSATALSITPSVNSTGQRTLTLLATVAAGLTQGKIYQLLASNTTTSLLLLDSEL